MSDSDSDEDAIVDNVYAYTWFRTVIQRDVLEQEKTKAEAFQ